MFIMPRSRDIGLGSLIVGAIALAHLAAGCGAKAHSGDACLKDFDCESGRCVQSTCVYVGASPVDGGVATDAADTAVAPDTATSDAAAD
jgi:hypothetical protein